MKHLVFLDEDRESSFEFQYERLIKVTQCRTQAELAALLGVTPASITAAQRNKDIPAHWLMTLLRERSINPQWILTGHGRMVLPSEEG